jgi:hypothetical protein
VPEPVVSARYVRERLVAPLAGTVLLLALCLATALATAIAMAWIAAAFFAWSTWAAARRLLRRDPVVTIDAAGIADHRDGRRVAWEDVEGLRTLDRRVMLGRVAFLEVVPREPLPVEVGARVRAVLRGDQSVVDARDPRRLMVEARHLDHAPEALLAAARAHRDVSAGAWRP